MIFHEISLKIACIEEGFKDVMKSEHLNVYFYG